MTGSIAGIVVPATPLAAAANELVRATADEKAFHHGRRVFLFGTLHGRQRGCVADPELLYVGAMFHDLGLSSAYRNSPRPYEIDGACLARDFLLARGRTDHEAQLVWLAVALHTNPSVAAHLEPEVALLAAGVETDDLGVGLAELGFEELDAVTAAHPRSGFKEQLLQLLSAGLADRLPNAGGNRHDDVLRHFLPGHARPDFVDLVRASPWPN